MPGQTATIHGSFSFNSLFRSLFKTIHFRKTDTYQTGLHCLMRRQLLLANYTLDRFGRNCQFGLCRFAISKTILLIGPGGFAGIGLTNHFHETILKDTVGIVLPHNFPKLIDRGVHLIDFRTVHWKPFAPMNSASIQNQQRLGQECRQPVKRIAVFQVRNETDRVPALGISGSHRDQSVVL